MKSHPVKFLALLLVRVYRSFSLAIHRILGVPDGGGCRFNPTCSEYTARAIEQYGAGKGVLIGIKRLLKCHPWSN